MAFWNTIPGSLDFVQGAGFATLAAAQADAITRYAYIVSLGANTSAQTVIYDDLGYRPLPRLTVPVLWQQVDRITATSWVGIGTVDAPSRFTCLQYIAFCAGESHADTLEYDGPEQQDVNYLLYVDSTGLATVYADPDSTGSPNGLMEDSSGQWTFRLGLINSFDAPGPAHRQYAPLGPGATVQAQDALQQMDTLTFGTALPDAYAYPPTAAVFGVGRPAVYPTAQTNPVLGDGLWVLGQEDNSFCTDGSPPDIGFAKAGTLSDPAYKGPEYQNYSLITGYFGRPPSPLPDDDGHTAGTFFVGIECRLTGIVRHCRTIAQTFAVTDNNSGLIDTTGNTNPSQVTAAYGISGGREYTYDWTLTEDQVDGLQTYQPDPPHAPPAFDGSVSPWTVGDSRSAVYAPCDQFVNIALYNGFVDAGMSTGTASAMADPGGAFPALYANYETPNAPDASRLSLGTFFQTCSSSYKVRAVYITRQTAQPIPAAPALPPEAGTGGVLTFSDWVDAGTFQYCPKTNGSPFCYSTSAQLSGMQAYVSDGPEHNMDVDGFALVQFPGGNYPQQEEQPGPVDTMDGYPFAAAYAGPRLKTLDDLTFCWGGLDNASSYSVVYQCTVLELQTVAVDGESDYQQLPELTPAYFVGQVT